MLEMVRDHQNNQHMSRLEWIVIWLIAVAVSGSCDAAGSLSLWQGLGSDATLGFWVV